MGARLTPQSRTLLVRALGALGLYLLLLAAWPLVGRAYAPLFRALASTAVAIIDPLPGSIEVRYEPGSGGVVASDVVHMDTLVRLRPREFTGPDANFGVSSFFDGYTPTALLLALFLAATPLAWRTRRARLLLALLALHGFLALRAALSVYYCYSRSTIDGRATVELGAEGRRALELAWYFACEDATANLLVPLILWALCVFALPAPDEAR